MASVATYDQTQVLTWFAQMVGVAQMLPPDERADLDVWDAQPGNATSDWPGWVRYLPPHPWPTAPVARPPRTYRKAPISRSLARAVMERDAYRCRWCGTHLDLTCDHVVPESLGGPTTLDNLQTLCRSCNSRKGTT